MVLHASVYMCVEIDMFHRYDFYDGSILDHAIFKYVLSHRNYQVNINILWIWSGTPLLYKIS